MKRVSFRELEYRTDGLYWLGEEPFSGIVVFTTKDGREKGQSGYLNGLRSGETREAYPDGSPMVEANFLQGVKHGRCREWHRDGVLAEDGEYEYGIALWSKTWSESGELEGDYRLAETDEAHARLLKYRELYATKPAEPVADPASADAAPSE